MSPEQDLQLLKNSNESLDFFRKHRNSILDQFNNQFVAIKKKDVIDNGKTMNELIQKLSKKGEEPSKLFIKFVSKDILIL